MLLCIDRYEFASIMRQRSSSVEKTTCSRPTVFCNVLFFAFPFKNCLIITWTEVWNKIESFTRKQTENCYILTKTDKTREKKNQFHMNWMLKPKSIDQTLSREVKVITHRAFEWIIQIIQLTNSLNWSINSGRTRRNWKQNKEKVLIKNPI